MPQAVAVPLGAAGISAIGGILAGRKSGGGAATTQQQDPTGAQQGITGLARMLQGQSQGIYNVGLPAYQRATGFYNSLLGSRTGQTAALAPALENIASSYQGAGNALSATTQRGPTQDRARAELQRESAGAAANLYRDAPFRAAEALGGLGTQGIGLAGNAASGAMSGYSGLLANQQHRDQMAFQQQQLDYNRQKSFWGGLGNLLPILLSSFGGGTGGKSKSGISSYDILKPPNRPGA